MRENSDGIPMAVFGLPDVKLADDLGVVFGDGEKDFLEEQGLGDTDLVLRGAGLGDVKFAMEAAKMQCK